MRTRDPEMAAAVVLREARIERAPVDPSAVAEAMGLRVREEPLDERTSGFLLRRADGTVLIGVNQDHHENRKRFTVAHEIGHYVLQPPHTGVIVDGEPLIDYRNQLASSGSSRREIQANRFAAALLMPRSFLERDASVLRLHLLGSDLEVEKLAREYKVSQQAMTYRLTNLGILRGW